MPVVQALRFVTDFQTRSFPSRHARGSAGAVLFILQVNRHIIDGEYPIIVNRLGRGKVQSENYGLIFLACVSKRIGTVKTNFVSAIPEHSLLPVLQIEIDIE